ncbi:hypothetical protein AB4Z54_05485 [Streptomyces sp. MCAF7]
MVIKRKCRCGVGDRAEQRVQPAHRPAGHTAGPADIGVAGGVNTIARTVGGAVGAQIAVAVLDAAGPAKAAAAPGFPAESGYTSAFAVFAVVACGALGASWAIPGKRHRVSSSGHQGRLRIPTD